MSSNLIASLSTMAPLSFPSLGSEFDKKTDQIRKILLTLANSKPCQQHISISTEAIKSNYS
jgi:hypothetical protein